MPTPRSIVKTGMTRVWLMETGAGPTVAPAYMGVWKAGAPAWGRAAATAIEIPADDQYDMFQEVDTIQGAEEKPTMTLTARYSQDLSEMLRIRRRGCVNDLQIHIGKCQDPQDYNGGWGKILAFDRWEPGAWGMAGDLGALSAEERAAVDETLEISAKDLYEIMRLGLAEICAVHVVQEVLDVTFCDAKSCGGECGLASDGCQKLFALIKSVGGSPGLGSQVVYSPDAGSTCGARSITTLPANQNPNRFACMGDYLVVVSVDSISHHYADRDLILQAAETWQEVAGTYVPGGAPRCIFCLKPGYAWIGGAGGYVYFLDNPANAPSIQDAGSATFQPLNDIHAFDEEHVLAVGDTNAVIYTTDGETWAPVTGPAPFVHLNCCWMKSETEWWVGSAAGRLYYTRNSGTTWTEKQFPGAGAGVVRHINFPTAQVGYLAHDTITPAGRILRTIDGGFSWYVLPEGVGTIPANDRINRLATCGEPNIVAGGGLADNGTDGILVKGS